MDYKELYEKWCTAKLKFSALVILYHSSGDWITFKEDADKVSADTGLSISNLSITPDLTIDTLLIPKDMQTMEIKKKLATCAQAVVYMHSEK